MRLPKNKLNIFGISFGLITIILLLVLTWKQTTGQFDAYSTETTDYCSYQNSLLEGCSKHGPGVMKSMKYFVDLHISRMIKELPITAIGASGPNLMTTDCCAETIIDASFSIDEYHNKDKLITFPEDFDRLVIKFNKLVVTYRYFDEKECVTKVQTVDVLAVLKATGKPIPMLYLSKKSYKIIYNIQEVAEDLANKRIVRTSTGCRYSLQVGKIDPDCNCGDSNEDGTGDGPLPDTGSSI